MRNNIIHILVCLLIGILSSCIQEDAYECTQEYDENASVTFYAVPKNFVKTNVGTRAGEDSDVEDGTFNVARFENKIYKAYFLLFDNTGTLRIKGQATIDEEGAVTYNIGRDVLSVYPSFRISFLANVSSAVYNNFVVDVTTWESLQNFYFDVTYAPISETGCPGVPQKTDLNDDGIYEYAMPMFQSKVVNAPYNLELDYYTLQLERLFAKVEMHVSLGIQRGTLNLNLTSQPQFTLTDCEIKNIPLSVPLLAQNGPTKCSDTSNGQVTSNTLPSYNLTTGLNRVLYTSSESAPDYRSFYFYMPEHKLGNCGSNSTQSNKPDLVKNTNKRATHLTFGGYLVGSDGSSYTAEYNIYFGENESDSFDLSRNTIYKNYVRINGVNNTDHRVTIVKDEDIRDVTRSGQTANCYIIGSAGTYMLPAYKGAFTDMSKAEMCEVGEDVVLACDNTNITITIDQVRSKQSTIVFTVAKSGANLTSGNAVIARRNASGIVWSWHLWFIPEASLGSSTDDLGNENRIGGLLEAKMYDKTSMADRNIGVVSSLTNLESWLPTSMEGVYYRYGYCNPYFEDKQYGMRAEYHGYNSANYKEWNTTEKSKTDPCPPGYRVPPITVWQGSNNSNASNQHYSPTGFDVEAYLYWNGGTAGGILTISDDIIYPYGYMKGTSELTVDSGTLTGQSLPSNYKLEEKLSEDTDSGWRETVTTKVFAEYTNVKYNVTYSANVGSLLHQSGIAPFMSLRSVSNITITSYDYQERTEVTTRTWTNPTGTTKTSWGTKSTVSNTQVSGIVSDIEDAYDDVAQFGTTMSSSLIGFSNNNGYQVRCMKQ